MNRIYQAMGVELTDTIPKEKVASAEKSEFSAAQTEKTKNTTQTANKFSVQDKKEETTAPKQI